MRRDDEKYGLEMTYLDEELLVFKKTKHLPCRRSTG